MPTSEHESTVNIKERVEQQLLAAVVRCLHQIGQVAQGHECKAFLVGGAVRDLLLGQSSIDLDIAVQGDVNSFVIAFAAEARAKITAHDRFGTATLQWDEMRVDFAMTRRETYARPGALPTVRPADIHEDLRRRDFTINAMAVDLNPSRFGELVDPFHGHKDLGDRFLRVLHDRSFIDDATRMLRAVRYEQRLGFRLEPQTEALVQRDVSMLRTISGDRLRREIEHILEEEEPEQALQRCQQLGVLPLVLPGVTADSWLVARFRQVREQSAARPAAYWGLLCFRLRPEDCQTLASHLRLPGQIVRTATEIEVLKGALPELQQPGLRSSAVVRLLRGYNESSLQALSIATDDRQVKHHLKLYMAEFRFVRPALDGERLLALGVPKGEPVGQLLRALLELRLDGKVTSVSEEEEYVRTWLAESRSPGQGRQ